MAKELNSGLHRNNSSLVVRGRPEHVASWFPTDFKSCALTTCPCCLQTSTLYINTWNSISCFIFDADKTLFCLILKAHLTTQILLILCKGLPLVVDDKKDSRIWYRMGKTCKERVGQRGLEGWGHLAMETWSLQDEQTSMTHINHSSCSTYNNHLIFSKQIWIFFTFVVHLIHLAC